MGGNISRRCFLHGAAATSIAGGLGLALEEQALLAQLSQQSTTAASSTVVKGLPVAKLGKLNVSRLIVGGNLTSGFAHSRDLLYVSGLLKAYFTAEKIIETWEICEECGINTCILRLDDNVINTISRYRRERGGNLQWIVQIKPGTYDMKHFKEDIRRAQDNGAVGAYIQGGVGDLLVQEGRVDVIGEAVQFIRSQQMTAGVGSHSLEVVKACVKTGIEPDFYMKTLHSSDYWSCNPGRETSEPFHVISDEARDNIWCTHPEATIDFMKDVPQSWIAFKVLAAGAIHPRAGFKYAFDNGADFICAGMFDFQVREDAIIAGDILSKAIDRQRAWHG